MTSELLNKAKKNKADEFYTQMSDIEAEMRHYKEHFRDKVILCNCDDPYESNFFKYFAMNFNYLGLKKLIATSYSESPIAYEQLPLFEIKSINLKNSDSKPPYKVEITEVKDENADGAIDLSDVEYFVGARGARKGLVDKGLKTADAGYLTRRLVDVSQDVIVREHDCGTESGREWIVGQGTLLQTFSDRLVGRVLAEDARVNGKIVVSKSKLLTREDVELIEKSGLKTILVRSPMHCETRRGVCSMCYGKDLMTGKLVNVGTAVGVAAAQSIGEPGTQLTMKTFHTGGIMGKDITQGLPRVEELVEARAPKFLATISEITGTVNIIKSGDERKIIVVPADKGEDSVEYLIDPVEEIIVKEGQMVVKGEKLTSGNLDLMDLYRTVGVDETKKYIIEEIQKVYASQGVAINDKHLEIIVKQMFNHVKIENAGDTEFMIGELVTRSTFDEKNEEAIASGGTPATGKLTMLGITRASLATDSFLSAASFIQTSSVLTDAAASGKVDYLLGLKENVIIGRLIPTGERAQMK